jgi:hypothetical protein
VKSVDVVYGQSLNSCMQPRIFQEASHICFNYLFVWKVKKDKLTLHKGIQFITVVFQDTDGLGVVGPVGEVCSLNVGAVVQHDPADALVPRVTPAQTGRVLGVKES